MISVINGLSLLVVRPYITAGFGVCSSFFSARGGCGLPTASPCIQSRVYHSQPCLEGSSLLFCREIFGLLRATGQQILLQLKHSLQCAVTVHEEVVPCADLPSNETGRMNMF